MTQNAKVCLFISLTLLLFFYTLTWADESDRVWSTFLGGESIERGRAIAVDNNGGAYVTGETYSIDFPVTTGVFDTTNDGDSDVFVVKINPEGATLDYCTFLGGSKYERGDGIALDGNGDAYVTGTTSSGDFPVTVGAFDTVYHGGFNDVFVAKLNLAGSILEYATFLGGSSLDFSHGIAVDESKNAYVIGDTWSSAFPTTTGAFDETHNGYRDAFVVKIDSVGSILVYATFLGGGDFDYVYDIAIDGFGHAYLTGFTWSLDFPTTEEAFEPTYNAEYYEAFVVKIDSLGSTLDYSTFLGGGKWQSGYGIVVDSHGSAYVTGKTASTDFPTTIGAFDTTHNGGWLDVFLVKLDPTGSVLNYATFLGGSRWEEGYSIALDDSGNVYVTGVVQSADFPTTSGAFDTTFNGPDVDAFVTKLNETGSALDYSTFLGGNRDEFGNCIAVDDSGNAYLTGATSSSDFPATTGAFDATYHGDADIFVVKLNATGSALVYATFLAGDSSSVPPDTLVPVESEASVSALPETCTLHQNYPNPFNASTEICYQLPEAGHVTLKIFNTLGQEVRTMVDAGQKASEYAVTWDGRDDRGHEVASGLYFCRLQAGDFGKTIKMVLVR